VREHGVGALGADHAHQVLARGSADAGHAAERGEQRLPPPRTDAAEGAEQHGRDTAWTMLLAGPAAATIMKSISGARAG